MRGLLETAEELHVLETFLTGSYARETMIRPLKDVDFIVRLHYGDHKNHAPLVLLHKLKQVLRSAYPLTPIVVTPPCVTVRFGYCVFEMTPAFGIQGDSQQLSIPNQAGTGWQSTYPRIPDAWMTEENKKVGGLFKPTIKMLKRWRDLRKIPLRSFHLEMLARVGFETYQVADYPNGAMAFFRAAKELFAANLRYPFLEEPGRSGVYVDQYLYDNRPQLASVIRTLTWSHATAQNAHVYMQRGNLSASRRLWRQMFGPEFAPTLATPTVPSFLLR